MLDINIVNHDLTFFPFFDQTQVVNLVTYLTADGQKAEHAVALKNVRE